MRERKTSINEVQLHIYRAKWTWSPVEKPLYAVCKWLQSTIISVKDQHKQAAIKFPPCATSHVGLAWLLHGWGARSPLESLWSCCMGCREKCTVGQDLGRPDFTRQFSSAPKKPWSLLMLV